MKTDKGMMDLSYIALYRKWRPLTFSDVVEQQHVVTALRNTVISRRIAHAYLFCGTRGTGKTTMAKIFARAINCLNPQAGDPCNQCEICKSILNESLLDVIEMDAASNNKVENVRDIRDEVAYAPSSAEFKVYIIDEVHMMTTSAFNALLKTLEEPPPQVVFILATTDPHKLPATILSRCQRFDFKRISKENIALRLQYIAENSDCVLPDDAAAMLARLADGALRDGVSLLDQCISTGGKEVTVEVVKAVTGMAGNAHLSETVEAIESGRPVELVEMINALLVEGKDLQRFSNDLNAYFRDLLVCSVSDQPQKLIDPSLDLKTLQDQAARLGIARISDIIRELSLLEYQLKQTTQIRTVFEAALIRMAILLPRVDATLDERLSLLEQRLDRGVAPRTDQPARPAPAAQPEPAAPAAPRTAAPKTTPADTTTGEASDAAPPAPVDATAPAPGPAPAKLAPFTDLKNVIASLNMRGKRTVSAYLSDAEAFYLENDVLGIVSKIGTGVLTRPEIGEPILAAIKEVTGHEMRIRVFADMAELFDAAGEYVTPPSTKPGVAETAAADGTTADGATDDIDSIDEDALRKAVEDLGASFTVQE